MKSRILSGLKQVVRFVVDIIYGKMIGLEFIKRHFPQIALLLFVIFGFIANRFSGMLEMRRIDNLENELAAARSEYIFSSARYFSKIREKTMKELVDTMKIGLITPQEPPYILNSDGEQN